MKNLNVCWWLVVVSLMLSVEVQAQSTGLALPDFKYVVRPYPGVYYDPIQSGTGLTVDTVAVPGQEVGFATYYHYTPDGDATWLNIATPITQVPLAEYAQTGLAAYMRGVWVAAAGGQCFDCAYQGYTVSYPPYGDRVIDIVGGRHMRLAASGNAATRNMKLAKTITPGSFSQVLLDSGAVWEIKSRFVNASGAVERPQGWLRFRKRPASEAKLNFTGADPRNPIPAFMDVPSLNTLQQYEARCVRKDYVVDGFNARCVFGDMDSAADPNFSAIVVDPVTDRIRSYYRCTSFDPTNCPTGGFGSTATIGGASDYLEAGPAPNGMSRIIVRSYSLATGNYHAEFELTQVPESTLKEVFPAGVPADNGP